MKRRMYGALVGALGLAMSAGAVLSGAGTAAAAGPATATAAAAGTVTLTPRSDSLSDGSPFTQVAVNKACPADYQDNVSVFLVVPDGTESAVAYDVTDGAPFAARPLTAQVPAASTGSTWVNSLSDAFDNVNATVADGAYPIHVVCGNADPVAFPERPTFTGFIDVTGDTWKPSSRPAPKATQLKLAATPAGHVQVGQSFTLTATVTPAVAGAVQFTANGFDPIGTPVQVAGGVATVTVPALTRPGVQLYTATFVPNDQLAYAQAFRTLDHAFVNAPAVTAADASGTDLGSNPRLAPGQQISLSATGFLPGAGEPVDVSVTNAYGSLPASFPAVASDEAGSVTNDVLTLPPCIGNGSHKVVLVGEKTHIKITYAFTTKRP